MDYYNDDDDIIEFDDEDYDFFSEGDDELYCLCGYTLDECPDDCERCDCDDQRRRYTEYEF